MRKLPKPCDNSGVVYVPKDVYDLCITKVKNLNLKVRLRSISNAVSHAAANYDMAATSAQLHKVIRQKKVNNVKKSELIDVYSKRMVPETQPGRPVYERILDAPIHKRCPLCAVGWVDTLDHHLPKKEYPILAVTPNNLVPSCMRCQKSKGTGYPKSAGEQTIHPYFDDFESAAWLQASVVHTTPATFEFFVSAPAAWDITTVQRLNAHLVAFDLPILYSKNAGSELSGKRYRLNELFTLGGSAAVQKYLQGEATSWEQESINSWQAAMFRAAASCLWFCGGGFK